MKRFRIEYLFPLFVVLLFGAVIAGIEWGIHLRWPDLIFHTTGDYEIDAFGIFDPRMGRWHRKNFSYRYEQATVKHNKNGIRDKDMPYEKKDHKKRIVIMGDSVPWGYKVNDKETFSDLLENKLPDTDIINMGVVGYGTGEEMLLLKYEGLRYNPDWVILFFCIVNDVQNNLQSDSFSSYPAYVFYLENGRLQIKPPQINFARHVGIWLNENSYIVNFLNKLPDKISTRLQKESQGNKHENTKKQNWVEQLNRENLSSVKVDYVPYEHLTYLQTGKKVPRHYFEGDEPLLSPTPENYYGVELTKKLILEIKKLADGANSRFLVVLSPFKNQLNTLDYYYENPLNKELMRFFNERGIDALDLLPLFVEKKSNSDDIYLDGCHFSVKGHQEVADILYDELIYRMSTVVPVASPNNKY
jgi:lysophospholipase L1-like esterase